MCREILKYILIHRRGFFFLRKKNGFVGGLFSSLISYFDQAILQHLYCPSKPLYQEN